jgi:hypothetical protein
MAEGSVCVSVCWCVWGRGAASVHTLAPHSPPPPFLPPAHPTPAPPEPRGVADSPRDLWYGIHGLRVHGITNMLLEAYHWIQSHFPYW